MSLMPVWLMMTGMWQVSPLVPSMNVDVDAGLAVGTGVDGDMLRGLTGRRSRMSLRMLKAPTGLPSQVRDLFQQLAVDLACPSFSCTSLCVQYRAAAQGVRQNQGQDLLRAAPVARSPAVAHHDDLVRQAR